MYKVLCSPKKLKEKSVDVNQGHSAELAGKTESQAPFINLLIY